MYGLAAAIPHGADDRQAVEILAKEAGESIVDALLKGETAVISVKQIGDDGKGNNVWMSMIETIEDNATVATQLPLFMYEVTYTNDKSPLTV